MRRNAKAFTLAEIMLVVALLGFLIAIAIPTFYSARELSRLRACQENMQKIDGSKQQWALERNAPADATPAWDDLIGSKKFIRKTPICPAGGAYTIDIISEHPSCSFVTNANYPHEFAQ